MSLDLKNVLASAEARSRARGKAKALEPAPAAPVPLPSLAPTPTPTRLPHWGESARGVPNAALRSALFCANLLGQHKREYVEMEEIFTQEGIRISRTGVHLDQGDLDAFVAIVHIARLQYLGKECRCTAAHILDVMGLTDAGNNRKTLDGRLNRLKATVIDLQDDRYGYQGNLIHEVYRDKKTNEYVIVLNEKLINLFAPNQFTKVEWSIRRALSRKPLAQWLHGYYSSHAKPYPITIETLRNLCGSETEELWKFTQTLRRALAALTTACHTHGQPFNHEIRGDLVEVQHQPSPSQARHLARCSAQTRRPKP